MVEETCEWMGLEEVFEEIRVYVCVRDGSR